ncbi:cell growth-regulating nucleolar protein isoform X1 [Ranitomeya imitator]|uniref:cell growth-regulating nucleolar protein isoform X1 n=2 Tax=Ranitomeya imitator TaxID=111125 RepID=UPI0037E767B2
MLTGSDVTQERRCSSGVHVVCSVLCCGVTMVFFTCNGCGESLKKAQVEKHVGNCRSCQCLSCIDCGKDFWGGDYKTHLKCVTEDEKYGGKGFEAKAKKGEEKQVQWIQRIQEAMKKPTISSDVRDILNQISAFDNVPKKKAKFQNWMKNSLKVHSPALQDKVWGIFEEAISNQKNNATEAANTLAGESKSESSAATEETEKKSKRERKEERQKKNKKEKKELNEGELMQNGTKKKGKKRKMEDDERNGVEAAGKKKKKRQREKEAEDESGDVEDEEAQSKKRNNSQGDEEEAEENGAEENGEGESGKTGKFNWKGTIRALLRQAPDNELAIKKLRKKVIAQYYAISSKHHKSEEELLATFNKKIQNNPKFRVLKERVKLVK